LKKHHQLHRPFEIHSLFMSVYTSDVNKSNENIESKDEDAENEAPLDPRIQFELERLNKSCADINKLENELEEAKSLFITTIKRQTQRLEYLQKKFGSCIHKAKPYYESLELTEKLQIETQKAVHEFQKANSFYKTAKETLTVAENSLEPDGQIPDEWQEHLSLTITKISLSKKAADMAEDHHRNKALEYQNAEHRSQYLEKDLKSYIIKSQLYYEEKNQWNNQMEAQKMRIHSLEQSLIQAKKTYKEAMANLSNISEEIHHKRNLEKILSESNSTHNTNSYDGKQMSLNESQSGENQEQLSNYLNLYNFSLPSKLTSESAHRFEDSLSNMKSLNAESEKVIQSEYISLGLNSTASNSRSTSPSNSLENDIEWKETRMDNGNHLNVPNFHQSSKTPSFSSSSVSRESNELQPQFFNNNNHNSSKTRSLTESLGSSSLTLKTAPKNDEKKCVQNQKQFDK